MAKSDAGLLAAENLLAALRKGRISPQAVEGILKGHGVFNLLGEAFFRGEVTSDRLSALLAPAVPRPSRILRPALPLTPDQERAARIMGVGFVSRAAYAGALRIRGNAYAAVDAAYARVPWTDDELAEEAVIQEDGSPRSILFPHYQPVRLPSLRKTFGTNPDRQPCFYADNDWWQADPHKDLRDKSLPNGWRLVRTRPEPNSTSITWDAQSELIPGTHERTWTLEAAQMMLLGFKTQKRRFLETLYAWCQDLDGDGLRSCAGCFGPAGLYLRGSHPSVPWYDDALVLSRKTSQPLVLGSSA